MASAKVIRLNEEIHFVFSKNRMWWNNILLFGKSSRTRKKNNQSVASLLNEKLGNFWNIVDIPGRCGFQEKKWVK